MHFLHVVGARPNFMKLAPVFRSLEQYANVRQTLVHTGQHYDSNMSGTFFQELGLPAPDINLQIGSGSHSQQTSQILSKLEPVVLTQKPDAVILYGDVNSTVAAALVSAKLLVPIVHVEAGLRSFDRTMPEEINRLVTDHLADVLFTPSIDADCNLRREGIEPERIFCVGNVMIDSLIHMMPRVTAEPLTGIPPRYALVTLHRPSNVDDHCWLQQLLDVLYDIGHDIPIVFPVHPRTRTYIADYIGRLSNQRQSTIFLTPPAPYIRFLALQRSATLVITDSGGIQEETTFLRIPCITVRENTERPITTTIGTNIIVGRDLARLRREVDNILAGRAKTGSVPALWDGKVSERIAAVLVNSRIGPRSASAPLYDPARSQVTASNCD